jgi:hypothetical protein
VPASNTPAPAAAPAPVARQQPAPAAAPNAPQLQRILQQRAPVAQTAPAPVQTELPISETPATFDETSYHEPADINPPEQPEEPIQDPDQLAAANEAAAPVTPKKKGRPAGSITVKPLGDEGQIFAMVFCKGLDIALSLGDPAPDELAGMMAKSAVETFRKL